MTSAVTDSGSNQSDRLFQTEQVSLRKEAAMQTALGVLAALLFAGALSAQPAHAQVQIQPAPGFSVQAAPQASPPPEPRRAREQRDRVINPIERDRCLDSLR